MFHARTTRKSGLRSGFHEVGAAAPASHIPPMPETARHLCPICGKLAVEASRPFCSRRCADVDLNRWLSGVYAIPVTEDEEEDERRDEGPPDGH
jgi:endogenous inhibitor of DNA gyrase (YacG/DUF329 family)